MTIPNIQKIIAKKHLGQNFLTDEFVLEKIIQAADIKPTDTIIEVGPGPGILTQALAPLCSKVIVIEKDPKMITILKETIKDIPNIEIHHDDILKFFIHEPKYKVVANIPYYITSPILTTFLLDQYISLKPLPELLVLMTQKEVADKIMAEPGDLSIIALKTQLFADVELVTYVSRESFFSTSKSRLRSHQTHNQSSSKRHRPKQISEVHLSRLPPEKKDALELSQIHSWRQT